MIAITQGEETVLMLKRKQWFLLRQLIGSMNSTDVAHILKLAGYEDSKDVQETQELIYKLIVETAP